MTPEKRDELRRLAEAATGGPWYELRRLVRWGLAESRKGVDGPYIVAADPQAILNLIDALDEAEKVIGRLDHTEDGKPMLFGDTVWIEAGHVLNSTNRPIQVRAEYVDGSGCYSTREAAEAARREAPDA